jgi:hypothetical protein
MPPRRTAIVNLQWRWSSGGGPVGEPERAYAADADGESDGDGAGLSEQDLAVLEFEARPWQHAGAKEQAIRDQFGLSAARYYQVLGRVIESPAALVHDPLLGRRLQRVRAARLAARAERLRPPR